MNQGQSAVPNLLGMARTAIEARNDEEAISYFNRVLEIDPTVSEAWLGKGRAVSRLSNLKQVRIHETAIAFGHAIGTTPEDIRPAMAELAIAELVFAVSLTNTANHDHFCRFASVEGTSAKCAAISDLLLDVLDIGLRWKPFDRPTLELIMAIVDNAIAYHAPGAERGLLLRRKDLAHQALRASYPDYAAADDAAAEAARAEEAASFDLANRAIAAKHAEENKKRRRTRLQWAMMIGMIVGLAILARL